MCIGSTFEKSLCEQRCHSEPLPGFPHTPTLWQVQSVSHSQLVTAHIFSQLQVLPGSPHSLALFQPVTTASALVCHQLCVCVCVCAAHLPLQATLCTQVSPGLGMGFACPGGEGAIRLLSLTRLSYHIVPVAAVVSGAKIGDFPCPSIKPPY